MEHSAIIGRLARERSRLRTLGVRRLSLFGSTARGEASDASDIDLAVTFDEDAQIDLFRFAALSEDLSRMLGAPVDLVMEPARNPRMQAEIDRDRRDVY